MERTAQDRCQAEILQSRYMAVTDVEAASDVVRILCALPDIGSSVHHLGLVSRIRVMCV